MAEQQWAETSSLWINPLLLCTPLHLQVFILLSPFSSQRGDFISPELFQKLFCASSALRNSCVKPLGLFQGEKKEKSRSLNNLTWNKIYSSSFNEYQNILPVRERNHFYLLWILAPPFNALSNVLSKLRTWIPACLANFRHGNLVHLSLSQALFLSFTHRV